MYRLVGGALSSYVRYLSCLYRWSVKCWKYFRFV